MPEHRRRRATQRSATPPIGPKGYGAPPALVSHRHHRVSDGLAWGRALGHSALLSVGRAPREHPEARKRRWVRCIVGRSRKLVR